MAHAKFHNSAATLQVVLTLISLKVNWSFSGRVALSLQYRHSSFIENCLYLLRNPQEQIEDTHFFFVAAEVPWGKSHGAGPGLSNRAYKIVAYEYVTNFIVV